MKLTCNKRGDLSFTIGLILSIMLIGVIAVSCTNIFKEGLSGRPGEKFKGLVGTVKALEQKPAGSSDVVVGYLGERHALVGFSSTALSVRKYPTDFAHFLSVLTIARPAECAYGTACVCIIENPKVVREPFPSVQLQWDAAICEKTPELFNAAYLSEGRDEQEKYYFKGGFLIARGPAVSSDSMTAGNIGFENVPPEPQITIEKTEHGIALCMDQPCIRRNMAEQQKQFVEANAKFAEARKAYDAGNYAEAQWIFNDIVLLEAQQTGKGFAGNAIGVETPLGKQVEGTEYLLNTKEHDKMYFLRAMSIIKQKQYDEAREALRLAELYASDPSVKSAAKNTAETIDCSVRSFAACITTEPTDICYRSVDEKECKQCTSETACADFDNTEACAGACGIACVWNNDVCAEAAA